MNEAHVYKKLTRLYIDAPFLSGTPLPLDKGQAHYLNNVLRLSKGDTLRIFNGQDGEWLGKIDQLTKKTGFLKLEEQLLAQPQNNKTVSLIFCPIKKNRLDFLIEKSVELGVDQLCPIVTQNTEVRKINEERLKAQIIEACEQCERLSVPSLAPITKLNSVLQDHKNIYAALERGQGYAHIAEIDNKTDTAYLIGPEGGFTHEEATEIADHSHVTPVTLGERILRAETAALYGLSFLNR